MKETRLISVRELERSIGNRPPPPLRHTPADEPTLSVAAGRPSSTVSVKAPKVRRARIKSEMGVIIDFGILQLREDCYQAKSRIESLKK